MYHIEETGVSFSRAASGDLSAINIMATSVLNKQCCNIAHTKMSAGCGNRIARDKKNDHNIFANIMPFANLQITFSVGSMRIA